MALASQFNSTEIRTALSALKSSNHIAVSGRFHVRADAGREAWAEQ